MTAMALVRFDSYVVQALTYTKMGTIILIWGSHNEKSFIMASGLFLILRHACCEHSNGVCFLLEPGGYLLYLPTSTRCSFLYTK